MTFADPILTEDLSPLRRRLLNHPLWEEIEAGTLARERLQLFALQDWLIVRDAYRLDGLAIAAAAPDLRLQELLIDKLAAKKSADDLLIRFGEGVGLTRADFENVEPLAGCMALVNYFYWVLSSASPGEALAAVGASEEVFVQICARIHPALQRNYGLSEAQVEFFTAHDLIGERVSPVEQALVARYSAAPLRRLLTRAVRLSHEFELLFYDTVQTAPLSRQGQI